MTINPYGSTQTSHHERGSDSSHSNTLRKNVRNGQIITFALIQGVVIVTAIMLFLARGANAEAAGGEPILILPILGIALGFAMVVGGAIAMYVLRRRAIHNFQCVAETVATPVYDTVAITPGISRLLSEAHTSLIVGLAILDGAAVFNAILYFLEHHWVNLAVVAVCIIAMAAQWPTLGKRLDLIEDASRG